MALSEWDLLHGGPPPWPPHQLVCVWGGVVRDVEKLLLKDLKLIM